MTTRITAAKETNTKEEIQLKLDSFSQRAHGLTRRLGYLLRLVSKGAFL